MTPLPRPSVSPLPASASIAPQRAESFAGALLTLARWLFHRQQKPSQRERQIEDARPSSGAAIPLDATLPKSATRVSVYSPSGRRLAPHASASAWVSQYISFGGVMIAATTTLSGAPYIFSCWAIFRVKVAS
jgi:hypothetical protein